MISQTEFMAGSTLRLLRSACQRNMRNALCEAEPMDTPGERLRWARKRAGYEDGTGAARAFGWVVSTYLGHENGDRNPSRQAAIRYARAFKIRWEWLLEGDGAPDEVKTNTTKVRIIGLVGAGGEVNEAYFDELTEVEVMMPLPPEVVAYQIHGNSMLPKYDPGDVIIVSESPSPIDIILGDIAMVVTKEGKRYLKRVLRGSKAGLFNLESFNAPTMEDVEITEAAVVYLIVPARRLAPPVAEKEINRRTSGRPLKHV